MNLLLYCHVIWNHFILFWLSTGRQNSYEGDKFTQQRGLQSFSSLRERSTKGKKWYHIFINPPSDSLFHYLKFAKLITFLANSSWRNLVTTLKTNCADLKLFVIFNPSVSQKRRCLTVIQHSGPGEGDRYVRRWQSIDYDWNTWWPSAVSYCCLATILLVTSNHIAEGADSFLSEAACSQIKHSQTNLVDRCKTNTPIRHNNMTTDRFSE